MAVGRSLRWRRGGRSPATTDGRVAGPSSTVAVESGVADETEFRPTAADEDDDGVAQLRTGRHDRHARLTGDTTTPAR